MVGVGRAFLLTTDKKANVKANAVPLCHGAGIPMHTVLLNYIETTDAVLG